MRYRFIFRAEFALLLVAIFPLLSTLPLDVIDIDSAQYAQISMEMVESGNLFRLTDNGRRYLDKPILNFLTVASSFAIFGISNWSYRLPALLLTILSFYSIYSIAILIWNDKKTAWASVLSYAVSPGLFAMVLDPKIDIYLTAYIIFAMHGYFLGRLRDSKYYYFFYFAMSFGFITKGPIGVVIPALAIGMDILLRRDFELLKNMKPWIGILIVAFLPLLWCYFLFLEFSTYGPLFFLWIQSFGRFYKDMYDIKFDPFFFYRSFGWALGNGSLVLLASFFMISAGYLLKKKNQITEVLESIDGKSQFVVYYWVFLYLFLISFSRYPLPQYIYWVLPGGALLLGRTIASEFLGSGWKIYPLVIGIVLGLGYFCLPFILEPLPIEYFLGGGLVTFLFLWLFRKHNTSLVVMVLGFGLFNQSLSLYYAPLLYSFQPASTFGSIIKEIEPNAKELPIFGISKSKRSYSFYAERHLFPVYEEKKVEELFQNQNKRLFVLPEARMEEFKSILPAGSQLAVLASRPSYKVATPRFDFLQRNEEGVAPKIALVQVSAPKFLKKISGKN